MSREGEHDAEAAARGPGSLDEVQARLRRFNEDRGWQAQRTLKDLAAAMAIEAAELQAIFLWEPDEHAVIDRRRRDVEGEFADVLIYALGFADLARIDVLRAVNAKIDANAMRYPRPS